MRKAHAARVLGFRGIGKSYGHLVALDGVTFPVAEAERVGLLGPRGAGKSTLFQIAAGLFAPDAGEVEVFGRSYLGHTNRLSSQIGIVFQSRSLDLDMPVKANLKFHGGLLGLFGRSLRQRIAVVCDIMEIDDILDTTVRTLSRGDQRRVEIARALLGEPKLLLLDDPTSGLDAPTRHHLVTQMRRVGEQLEAAMLWATRLVEEVEDADRVVILQNGHVIADDDPVDLVARAHAANLAEAYVVLTGETLDP